MSVHPATGMRMWWVRVGLIPALLMSFCCLTLGQESTDILQVEEDWELVVRAPDTDSTAPQVATVISPVNSCDSLHVAFELNHQSLPSFTPGGMQLQLWLNETPLGQRTYPNPQVLSTEAETITWTQAMNVEDNALTFEILNGTSTTWGSFGGQGYLRIAVPTHLADLNGYTPNVSSTHSGVSYADHRVTSLILKRVRVTYRTGDEVTLELDPIVFIRN